MTPSRIDQTLQSAIAHHRAGKLAEAEALYRQVLAQQPRHANALNLLGVIASQVGQFDTAIQLIRQAIQIDPSVPGFHNNLGNALRGKGESAAAADAFRQAVRAKPDFAEAFINLSNALSDLGQFEEAIAACDGALRVHPRFAEAYNNKGCALMDAGKWPQALTALEKCLELEPGHFGARYNYSRVLLTLGRWKEGWAEFDSRLKLARLNLHRSFRRPQWDGTDPTGKTILLHAEGGHGDALNFIRFVPQVAQRGAKLILECQPALVRLFDGYTGLHRVIARGQELPEFDWQIPLQSLPHVLGVTVENIPSSVPYLTPPADRVQHWASRLGERKAPRVGLAWSGAKHDGRDSRSRTLDVFAPLAQIAGVEFFSLQTGPDARQPPPAGLNMTDFSDELTDFYETASLIQNLDLVISIDTSIAHLAGAIARPMWVLIPAHPDFRWLLDRTDTPWYPTMRLFRQQRAEPWTTVTARIARALAEQIAGNQP